MDGDEVEKTGAMLGLPRLRLNLGDAIKSEYHQIVDNPKRLPFFLHPIISREREFTLSGNRTYFTPSFYLHDQFKVPRRVYLNFDAVNVAFGATGGLLIGLTTGYYTKAYGRFANLASQTWLKHVEQGTAIGIQRFVFGGIVASRIVKRAVVGAVMFDMLRRSMEKERQKDDFVNATFAGFLCGAAFGLRGGFHTGVLGAFAIGSTATILHLFTSEKS